VQGHALHAIGAKANRNQHPTGTYRTVITEADLPPDYPPEFILLTTGQWEVEFSEDRRVFVVKEGAVVVERCYTSNPVRLVMTDLYGPFACLDSGWATGVYDWAFANNELTLTVVQDACIGRLIVLVTHPLQKQ
jgi:hypothetical protein